MISNHEIFTEDAMTRPLFQEPSPEIEREDPWTGPKGFMFGGMSQATVASLAEEYFEAANLIIDCIKRNELEDYKLANAALFLYRHSVELILKAALIEYDRTHDLNRLAGSLADKVRSDYKQEVPEWIMLRLKELAAIDPGSVAFRYAAYRDPLTKQSTGLVGEIYVDLLHLQRAMKALNTALVRAVGEIAMARGWRPD
jgi:HEPN domain-containing protein